MQALSDNDLKALAGFANGEVQISDTLKKKLSLLKQKVEMQEKFLAEAMPIEDELRKVIESEHKK